MKGSKIEKSSFTILCVCMDEMPEHVRLVCVCVRKRVCVCWSPEIVPYFRGEKHRRHDDRPPVFLFYLFNPDTKETHHKGKTCMSYVSE